MPNLLSRTPLEFPKKGAELYAVLDGKDYRVKVGDILKLLTAADLGLDKVENTADLDKPIAKAVQAALDRKAAKTDLEDLVTVAQMSEAIREALRNFTPPGGGQGGQGAGVSEERINEIVNNFWTTQLADGGVVKLIQTDVADAKSAVTALTEKVQEHTGKFTQNDEDVTALKNKVAGIEDALKVPGNPDQSAGITANTAAIAALGERVTAVEAKATAAATKEDQDALGERVTTAEGKLEASATKEEHTALTERVRVVEEAQATAELPQLKANVNALMQDQASYVKIGALAQHVEPVVEAKLSNTTGRISALETAKNEHEQKLTTVEQSVHDLTPKVQQLETSKETYNGRVDALEPKVQVLEQFKTQSEGKIQNLETFKTTAEVKIEEITEVKNTADRAKSDIQLLQTKIQQMEADIQLLKTKAGI